MIDRDINQKLERAMLRRSFLQMLVIAGLVPAVALSKTLASKTLVINVYLIWYSKNIYGIRFDGDTDAFIEKMVGLTGEGFRATLAEPICYPVAYINDTIMPVLDEDESVKKNIYIDFENARKPNAVIV